MDFQNAIERAIAFRLRAKKELDPERRLSLLGLAQEWEVWAEHCRESSARGAVPEQSRQPAEDI